MNVADLTDVQIMQLPDFCFGERFVCSTYYVEDTVGYYEDISPIVLPDKCVLWEIDLWFSKNGNVSNYLRMSLGYALPGNEAAFLLEQPLIEELGHVAPTLRGIFTPLEEHHQSMHMKQLLTTGGKRFLTMFKVSSGGDSRLQISAVFSGIPLRVPDWMISI